MVHKNKSRGVWLQGLNMESVVLILCDSLGRA
jgi:hypothetical protein